MKIATVRDIRTKFPVVEGWLAETGIVAITKSGRIVAKLVPAKPSDNEPVCLNFAERYAHDGGKRAKSTNISGMLIRARE